jgi:hypothetical protein
MTDILVLANETIGGKNLLDTVLRRRDETGGDVHFHVVVPQTRPRHGNVIYDDAVRDSAQVRVDLALAFMKDEGIDGTGEVGDADPYNAALDAIGERHIDELLVSTLPASASGWLRRDLIDRVRDASGVPVEHVVVDLDADRADATRTLVVANQTVGGEPLIGLLRGKAQESPHSFIVISPQGGAEEGADAHQRLAHTLQRLHEEGLDATGQVMDPDPFTAIQNALQFYAVDEIVISTFPSTRSGWLRSDLVGRVQASTSKPVEHVVVNQSEATEGATA